MNPINYTPAASQLLRTFAELCEAEFQRPSRGSEGRSRGVPSGTGKSYIKKCRVVGTTGIHLTRPITYCPIRPKSVARTGCYLFMLSAACLEPSVVNSVHGSLSLFAQVAHERLSGRMGADDWGAALKPLPASVPSSGPQDKKDASRRADDRR
jgi:hypothetical protein